MNSTQRVSGKIVTYLIVLLLAIYVINVFTPLRLTFDTIRYFKIKEWIEAGRPPGTEAANDFLPAGYVWFLYLLDKLEWCISPVITFIQLLFFVGACYVVSAIDGNRKYFPLLLAVCLLSWTVLKFVITPLSEMLFLFSTCLALFFFYRWEKSKSLPALLLFVLFAVLSVYTRTAGLSLVIAGILYFVIKRFSTLFFPPPVYPKVIPIVLVLGAALFIALSDVMHINEYLQFLSGNFQYGVGFTLSRNAWFHLIDFASLFLNMPAAKVPFVPSAATNLLFAIAGLSFLCIIIYLLISRKTNMHLMLRLYIGVYLLMIFNWPYYETRFFVPVVPLIAVLLIRNFYILPPLIKNIMKYYFIIFGLIGITALGYYSYTSVNRKALARYQDAGIWRNEYETYFFGKPLGDTATNVRKPVVDLLRKYN